MQPAIQKRAVFYLVLSVFALAISQVALAEGYKLEKGRFIVATDQLRNSPFEQAVIYITQAGDVGTYGLMVNRPTGISLGEVFADETAQRHHNDQVFYGGPLHNQYLFSLAESPYKQGEVLQVDNTIMLGAGLDTLTRFSYDSQNTKVKTFIGYASWTPGQLQKQIEDGAWIVVPADPELVFSEEDDDLWTTLTSRWGGDWT
ncbi:MAG: YqgE/AlgH family protein [Gammaproteobacteria bacterium]|nr:YqgE/AlgH family protein [Gammaproteobacteria bacterium]